MTEYADSRLEKRGSDDSSQHWSSAKPGDLWNSSPRWLIAVLFFHLGAAMVQGIWLFMPKAPPERAEAQAPIQGPPLAPIAAPAPTKPKLPQVVDLGKEKVEINSTVMLSEPTVLEAMVYNGTGRPIGNVGIAVCTLEDGAVIENRLLQFVPKNGVLAPFTTERVEIETGLILRDGRKRKWTTSVVGAIYAD